MSALEDDIATLERNGFACDDQRPARDYITVRCSACKARWSLGVQHGAIHAGAVLKLLNHASGHGKRRIA